MRTAIPRFSELIAPLQGLLETQYQLHNKRKKTKLFNRPISAWGAEADNAFSCLISAISNQVKLALSDSIKRICLFTDASSTNWAGVLTQVPITDTESNLLPPQEWEHEPISFVSGSFKGPSLRWSTPEQECYAVVASVTRLSHILAACEKFSLFTDHKNLLYMLSPNRFDNNVARHVIYKTQRWAIRLAEFNFTTEHIPGESNTWADMLTRWAASGFDRCPAKRISLFTVPLITETPPELPSLEIFAESQRNATPCNNPNFKLQSVNGNNVWMSDDGKLYVPPEDVDLQLRICVAAHCGLGGHRGITATKMIIREKVEWPTLDADVEAFCQDCFVCIISETGQKVPRPLGHQEHAERVSEILHFDFLYIGESSLSFEYILILKDDFSGYVYLRPCRNADATSTAEVLLEYFSTFVPVLKWFSDQGPHFANEVMEVLASALGARHRFSTAYVPWSNGTVEAV